MFWLDEFSFIFGFEDVFSMIDSEILFWSLQQFLDFLLRDLSGVLSFCQSVHNLTFHLVFFCAKGYPFWSVGVLSHSAFGQFHT